MNITYNTFGHEHKVVVYMEIMGEILINSNYRRHILYEISDPIYTVNDVYYTYEKTLVVDDDFNIRELADMIDKKYKVSYSDMKNYIHVQYNIDTSILILFLRHKDLKNYYLRR